MGQSTSELRKSATLGADIKEQLDFLVKVADFKLDKFQHEIERGFTDPEYTGKRQVPGKRALRWVRGYRVGIKKQSADVAVWGAEVNGIISSFLGLHNPDEGEKFALETLKKNVVAGIAFILESENVGETEDKRFFVFMLNNAVIRIDACIWKYNFSSDKVLAEAEDVLCYTLCLSVVDHTILHVDEMVFLVSEYTGTPPQTIDYTRTLSSLWYHVNQMAVNLPSDAKNKANEYGGPRYITGPGPQQPGLGGIRPLIPYLAEPEKYGQSLSPSAVSPRSPLATGGFTG